MDTTTSITVDEKNKKRIGGQVLDHYTILSTLERAVFTDLSDEAWNQLDANHDQLLTKSELSDLAEIPSYIRFEASFYEDSQKLTHLNAKCNAADLEWAMRVATSGQVNGKRTAVGAQLLDNYSAATKQQLRQQLETSLDNTQLQVFIRTQLQLGENAFAIVDENGDKKLDDDEFNTVWNWIVATRSNRMIVRWLTVAENVWFRLADRDGDRRLTEIELQNFAKAVHTLDLDKDGSVSPSELPFVARVEISRSDPRVLANPLGTTPSMGEPEIALDWFSASDTNNDGFLSKQEFLGSLDDFSGYDRDNDGFISRQETYEVK